MNRRDELIWMLALRSRAFELSDTGLVGHAIEQLGQRRHLWKEGHRQGQLSATEHLELLGCAVTVTEQLKNHVANLVTGVHPV